MADSELNQRLLVRTGVGAGPPRGFHHVQVGPRGRHPLSSLERLVPGPQRRSVDPCVGVGGLGRLTVRGGRRVGPAPASCGPGPAGCGHAIQPPCHPHGEGSGRCAASHREDSVQAVIGPGLQTELHHEAVFRDGMGDAVGLRGRHMVHRGGIQSDGRPHQIPHGQLTVSERRPRSGVHRLEDDFARLGIRRLRVGGRVRLTGAPSQKSQGEQDRDFTVSHRCKGRPRPWGGKSRFLLTRLRAAR